MNDLITRLRDMADWRASSTGKPDNICRLLYEAADALYEAEHHHAVHEQKNISDQIEQEFHN